MVNIRLGANLNVTGTGDNDNFIADGGSKGNFTIDGTGGNDTVDYSQLGQTVTLAANGVVNKGVGGSFGSDTVKNVEGFIGANGQTNTIDGTTNGGPVSFNIDLSKDNLTLDNLNGRSVSFKVQNFSQVIGTNNNDTIKGNNTGNTLTGGKGNDILTGGNGNDILNGTNSTARGVGEVDKLIGGGGRDTFVFGDSNGAFYLGNGANDYASIEDFDFTKDRIQLGGNKDLLSVKFDRQSGTIDLFSKQNGGSDLVAKVKLANPFSFSSRSETMGMSNARTAMAANSGMNGETSLSPASIGGDSSSIEAMFAKSIVA